MPPQKIFIQKKGLELLPKAIASYQKVSLFLGLYGQVMGKPLGQTGFV